MRAHPIVSIAIAALQGGLIVSCGDTTSDARWHGPFPVVLRSPAGIYSGSITSTGEPQAGSIAVSGIVSQDEMLQLVFPIDARRHLAGPVQADGSSFDATLLQYLGRYGRFFGIDGVEEITMGGTITYDTSIVGTYSGTTDTGSITLEYQSLYETGSSTALATGVWTSQEDPAGDDTYAVNWSIDSDGEIFGTDSIACAFSGHIGTPDSHFNEYAVTVDVSLCGELNGRYRGLAFLQASVDPDPDRLTIGVSNPAYAFAVVMEK